MCVSPLTSHSLAICSDCIVGKCLMVALTCCGYPENAGNNTVELVKAQELNMHLQTLSKSMVPLEGM